MGFEMTIHVVFIAMTSMLIMNQIADYIRNSQDDRAKRVVRDKMTDIFAFTVTFWLWVIVGAAKELFLFFFF